eukprot:gene11610-biopygen11918
MQADRASKATQPVPVTGTRLELYWPLDEAWYPGIVADISAMGKHHIEYDDGDNEWLLLSEELTRPEQQ